MFRCNIFVPKDTIQLFFISVPPVCSPKGVKVYGVAKRETAHIACKVEANPPKVSFR